MSTVYKAVYEDDKPIVHWRTKGSKNGVRLWQNEDGSYTEAGRNSKPGGRYNTDYDPKAAREAKRAAKEQASIDKTRQRNQSTNDKIAARIPYSRDDLSEYERAQELSLMNNQLKYLKDIKEYQKQNESSHFQQVAHELKKELKSTEIKFYAAVGLGALGIGAAYLIGSGAIDPSIIKTAKDIAGGNVSNLFNSAVDNSAAVTAGINNAATTAGKAVADTATTAGKAVADTASNAAKTGQSAIDRLKGALGSIGKGNALVVTDDPGRVTYDSNQWIADMKSAAANSAKTEPRTEAEWLSSYMPSVYGSESYQNAFSNLSAADQAKILADNRTEQHDIIGRIVRAEGSGNDATRLKQLQSMDRSALLNALNRANNAASWQSVTQNVTAGNKDTSRAAKAVADMWRDEKANAAIYNSSWDGSTSDGRSAWQAADDALAAQRAREDADYASSKSNLANLIAQSNKSDEAWDEYYRSLYSK